MIVLYYLDNHNEKKIFFVCRIFMQHSFSSAFSSQKNPRVWNPDVKRQLYCLEQ